MLVAILIIYIIIRWMKSKKNLRIMTWKIAYDDLIFKSDQRRNSFSAVSGNLLRTSGSIGNEREKYSENGDQHGSIRNVFLNRGNLYNIVAFLNGNIVRVKRINKKSVTIDNKLLSEMKTMTQLKHANLTTLIGVCIDQENVCAIWEYCQKGSIQDVIKNENILNIMLRLSIAIDVSKGLEYIHNSDVKFHGNLKSSNCVIDSHWVCKLTDFGLTYLKNGEQANLEISDNERFTRLFWTAPEILRRIFNRNQVRGSAKGDIYAFGIILKELICKDKPFATESEILTPKEIIYWMAYPVDNQIFRPSLTDTDFGYGNQRTLCTLIQKCWQEDPYQRPDIRTVLKVLNTIKHAKFSMVDDMMITMEKYSKTLEELVSKATEQLTEKRKTDQLLYKKLPKKLADDLKVGKLIRAEVFDSVSIYFSDIVEFTTLVCESTPIEIVAVLNELYTVFDETIEKYDVLQVETIGDAYMLVSGLPERNGNLHVREIARVSLSILNALKHFVIPHKPERKLEIRIGIHTGRVVAGIVGSKMPRYCLFGESVSTAARMEKSGKPLSIHISPATREALRDFAMFCTVESWELEVKGNTKMKTYWLIGENLENSEKKASESELQLSNAEGWQVEKERSDD